MINAISRGADHRFTWLKESELNWIG
uniref:Uncharacterized protein n=1 Tax=Nelumbo nucifera TaxID=4432 RepID=A0A822Y7E6_NELNU|nr:TPA_asm: hypothetical protein HUJ06_028584 [Nelumbo nucifera]